MQEQTLFNVDIKKPKKEHYSTSTKSPWFWSWKISMNGQGHYWKFGKDDTNWTLKAGRSEFRSEERSYRPYMIRNGPYHRQSLIHQSWNFSLLFTNLCSPILQSWYDTVYSLFSYGWVPVNHLTLYKWANIGPKTYQ